MLPLLALLALLSGLARRRALAAAAALVLTLLEGAVAQVLLLVDHVAEIVELLHHLAEVVAVHVRRRHLQVFHHLLELLQQLTRGVLGAAARHALQAVEHVLEVLLAQHARIAVERTGELLIVLELLLHRLHEAVHGGAQLVHQLLELLVAGAAVERVAQRFLRGAQGRLRFGNIAVLEADRHRPQPRRYLAQVVVALGAHQRPEDRAQPEIDAGLGPEFVRPEGQRIDRGDDLRTDAGVEREITPLLDQRLRQRFGERALGQMQGERLAPALVAAFIARRERHDHLGAAQGWSVTSLMVCAMFSWRACGRTSEKSGGPYSDAGRRPSPPAHPCARRSRAPRSRRSRPRCGRTEAASRGSAARGPW